MKLLKKKCVHGFRTLRGLNDGKECVKADALLNDGVRLC